MIDFLIVANDCRIVLAGQAKTEADARLNVQPGQAIVFEPHDGVGTHFVEGRQEDRRPVPAYAELRRNAYPPLSELADALYWQAQGDETKMQAYLAACEAVKTKYPKG